MEDAQCAETNKKRFYDFYFSSYHEKFIENWGDDVIKNACKTLKSSFFWFAVDTNLFRLWPTNPKKNSETLGAFFFLTFFFSEMFEHF